MKILIFSNVQAFVYVKAIQLTDNKHLLLFDLIVQEKEK